ncbi:hypothetical protein ECP03052936_0013, partial [Escherichia coli p0305293.6]
MLALDAVKSYMMKLIIFIIDTRQYKSSSVDG